VTTDLIAPGFTEFDLPAFTSRKRKPHVMTTTHIDTLVARYTALWTEPDVAVRRQVIEQLWTSDGTEHTGVNQYYGHDAIESRISAAYDRFFAAGENGLRLVETPVAHDDAVTFTIQIAPIGNTDATWTGRIFLLIDGQKRILTDYQFTIAN
jgi:hypothetical protein